MLCMLQLLMLQISLRLSGMGSPVSHGINCAMLMKSPCVHRRSCGEALITMTKRYVLALLLLSHPLALLMTARHSNKEEEKRRKKKSKKKRGKKKDKSAGEDEEKASTSQEGW